MLIIKQWCSEQTEWRAAENRTVFNNPGTQDLELQKSTFEHVGTIIEYNIFSFKLHDTIRHASDPSGFKSD